MITKTLPLHMMHLTALREAVVTLERLSSRVSAPGELEALALGRQLLRAEVQRQKMTAFMDRYGTGGPVPDCKDRESKDEI